MGWIKRIVHGATKDWKNANAQWKDVVKIQKIQDGEKVLPPKHPSEAEAFKKAANDPKLKELIDKKDEKLIENVNKIKIESTDPPERWTATKMLPSRESEFEHRNDPVWQYGFFEPPLEKMEKNRIMFREALEVLRNRMEFDTPGPDGKERPLADEAVKKYNSHPAVQRIDPEKLELMWQYFRPFERNDTQRIVKNEDLQQLEDIVEGRGDIMQPEYAPVIEALSRKKDKSHRLAFAQKLLEMPSAERQEYIKFITEKQQAEKKRLDDRLEEMKLLDEEFKKQAEEASSEKAENDKKK
uniref:39S ribosomal protein L59, mitochondrial n=1 Tax=Panagrolaimus superbus TaxID=310955 RepID=A0A914YQV8_9BILA